MLIARFPVLSYPPLLWFFAISHALVLLSGFVVMHGSEVFLPFVLALNVSARLSRQRYLELTHAPDDLCWSGEYWQMQQNDSRGEPIFLELQASSWTTRYFALLIFAHNGNTKAWLFVRAHLGAAAWSRLMTICSHQLTLLRNAGDDNHSRSS